MSVFEHLPCARHYIMCWWYKDETDEDEWDTGQEYKTKAWIETASSYGETNATGEACAK